jgi:uncharacterized protein (TIGR03435 family)
MMVGGLIIGGPGSDDPGRLRARNATLRNILLMAFGVKYFQLSGPDSLETHWDIEATIPQGATAEQVHEMLRALLEDRFHLKVRRETKMISGYNLVLARNGLKLKNSIDASLQSTQTGIANSGSGPAGSLFSPPAQDGGRVMQGRAVSLAGLTNMLQTWVGGQPVIDETGLTGRYDLRIEFSPADVGANSAFPSLFTAIENLGLKLEPAKIPLEMVTVEHIDSMPTGN